MRRWQIWRGVLACLAWVLTASFMSCADDESPRASTDPERETICVAREGGQTGMEGSCLPRPEPKSFPVEAARALIEGTHTTTLAYRPKPRTLDAAADDVVGLPMTVRVELEGDAQVIDRAASSDCGFRIRQDVKVTLSFDDPKLDLVIDTIADAFSSTFAVVVRELGSDVAEALGLPPSEATLALAFHANGIEGSIDSHDDSCGAAVFPADARCPEWTEIEVDLDRERDGFRPRDALSDFEELDDVPLRWSDGSETTVALMLVEPPGWACSREWIETFTPESLAMLVVVRAVTADGRLDVELPAELTVAVSTEASVTQGTVTPPNAGGVIQSLDIIASNVPVPAASVVTDLVPNEDGDVRLTLRLWKTPERTHAEGQVSELELRDLGLTPPLDRTIDPARAVCAADPGGSAEIER
jgi:hypothetical protein